ncbi:MAG TPA: hypothetical protein VD971_00390 [Phycisphaerales bacterium]|nr:hypothetical protein [Phycisphaerales bacterium]
MSAVPANADRLVARFIGTTRTDDAGLLGVPEGAGRDAVLDGLRTRLGRVSAHPDARTAEAAEVRMMLHAAAGRMLMVSGDASRSTPRALAGFDQVALMTVGIAGGLNSRAMHQLQMLSVTAGVSPQGLVDSLRRLGESGAMAPPASALPPRARPGAARRVSRDPARRLSAAGAPAGQAPPEEPEQAVDPAARLVRRVVVGGVIGLGALIVLAFGLRIMLSGPKKPPVTPGPIAADQQPASPPRPPASTAKTQAPPAPPKKDRTAAEIVKDLRALDGARPDASATLGAAIEELAARWHAGTPAQTADILSAVMEPVFRAPESARRTASDAATGLIGDDPAARAAWTAEGVPRFVLGAMIGQRLLRERDLDAASRRLVETRVRRALGPSAADQTGSPARIAAVALERAAALMIPLRPADIPAANAAAPLADDDAWAAWAACVKASVADADTRERVTLGALERALASSVEPNTDAAILAALHALPAQVSWGRGSPGRERVLTWLARRDISAPKVTLLTQGLVAQPGSDLDISFVLTSAASDADRADLRDRLATVWNLQGAGLRAESVAELLTAAGPLLQTTMPATPADRLARARALCAWNTAAALVWSGETERARQLLESEARVRPAAPAPVQPAAPIPPGSWGESYLLAGNDMARRRGIIRGAADSPPGRLEARLLVEEAMRGGNAELRAEARSVVLKHAASRAVVGAMLDFAPFAPATETNRELIEAAAYTSLPAVKRPAFRVEARRALVLRLLAMLTSSGASYDEAAAVMSAWYEERLAAEENPPAAAGNAPPAPSASEDPSRPARELRRRLFERARGAWAPSDATPAPTELALRHDQRVRAASGAVQEFAAEQCGVVEAMARLVHAERAAAEDRVAAVLARWRREMRSSDHVFAQVEACEEAQARLWVIRMGGEQ